VLRLTAEKHLSVVFTKDKLGPGGLAIHKDERIFIAGVGDLRGAGSIVAIDPDGSKYANSRASGDGLRSE
jgi:lactonase